MTTRTNPWSGAFPELRGRWFGQAGPGEQPVELCPEVFSPENRIAGITFSQDGDEAFFSLNVTGGECALMWTRMIDGVWTKPEPAPFNSAQIDNDVVMSPDGEELSVIKIR